MRKLLLIVAAVLAGILSLRAQDLVVRTDSVRIPSKVLEIAPEEIRFKKASNIDGPTYILKINQVAYIVFANGSREFFAVQPASLVPSAPAVVPAPAPAPKRDAEPAAPKPVPEQPAVQPVLEPAPQPAAQPAHPRYVLQRYEVGEYYNYGGVKGIVCAVTEDGQHGLVIALHEQMLPWCASKQMMQTAEISAVTGKDDGLKNHQEMMQYIENQGLKLSAFPALAFCQKMGEGWYIPAINEWLAIVANFNGGNRAGFNRAARNKFNDALHDHGGQKMDRLVYYLSSTQCADDELFVSHNSPNAPYVVTVKKFQKWLVRPVHKF